MAYNGRTHLCTAIALVLLVPATTFATTAPVGTFLIAIVVTHARDATGGTWNSSVSFVYTGEGRVSDLSANQPVRLIGVPLVAGSRTLVRIYALVEGHDANVRVHAFDALGNVLAVDDVHMAGVPVSPQNTTAPQPAYAEYHLPVTASGRTTVSIDIESTDVPFKQPLWAFSTTTGPHSASVTAVFPTR